MASTKGAPKHPYELLSFNVIILAIFYPPLKQIRGCFGLILQTWKGHIYFTELAEKVEYGKWGDVSYMSR